MHSPDKVSLVFPQTKYGRRRLLAATTHANNDDRRIALKAASRSAPVVAPCLCRGLDAPRPVVPGVSVAVLILLPLLFRLTFTASLTLGCLLVDRETASVASTGGRSSSWCVTGTHAGLCRRPPLSLPFWSPPCRSTPMLLSLFHHGPCRQRRGRMLPKPATPPPPSRLQRRGLEP